MISSHSMALSFPSAGEMIPFLQQMGSSMISSHSMALSFPSAGEMESSGFFSDYSGDGRQSTSSLFQEEKTEGVVKTQISPITENSEPDSEPSSGGSVCQLVHTEPPLDTTSATPHLRLGCVDMQRERPFEDSVEQRLEEESDGEVEEQDLEWRG